MKLLKRYNPRHFKKMSAVEIGKEKLSLVAQETEILKRMRELQYKLDTVQSNLQILQENPGIYKAFKY